MLDILRGTKVRVRSRPADALGHQPTLDALRDLQKNDSYVAAGRYLEAETDSAARQLCFNVLGRALGANDVVARWTQEHPDDPNAFIVAGFQEIHRAWEKRGGGRAENVRPQQWEGFFEHLAIAQHVLDRASELAPTDPMLQAVLITLDMGAERPVELSMERLVVAMASDPAHYTAHQHLLLTCCEKWHGNHQIMFQVARAPDYTTPGYENLAALICLAHIECTLFDSAAQRKAYWKSEEVAKEIAVAFDNSVGRPGFEGDAMTPVALNVFAAAFWELRDRDRCQRAHGKIGKNFDEWSWLYTGGKPTFDRSRQWRNP